MDLVTNGLFSSMEYNASTMVASKHHARSVVLNHSTEQAKADLKDQVENSKYNDPGTFGEMPDSAHCLFWHLKRERGDIRVKPGPIQPEVNPGPGPGNKGKKNRANQNASSSSRGNKQGRGGNSFRGKGRGKGGSFGPQKQGSKQNFQANKPKNSKSRRSKPKQ